MFYFTSKAALTLAVAMLGLEGGLPLPDEAQQQAPEPTPSPVVEEQAKYLDIYGQGYSRFEIMGDDIVAHFAGGVDFAYMGYTGHADDLLYNHASQQAIASGDVSFTLGDVTLASPRAVLDINAGQATLEQSVYGAMNEKGILLEATAAVVTFTPGEPPQGLEQVQAELSGGVHLFTTTGSWLTTEAIHLDGGQRKIQTQGAFVLSLSEQHLAGAQEHAGARWGATHFSGTQAVLYYDEDGLLSKAEFNEPLVSNEVGRLAASRANIERSGAADQPRWDISLSGAPITGSYAQGPQQYALSCTNLAGQLLPDGTVAALLSGDVAVDTAEQNLSGQRFELLYGPDGGWRVLATDGLEIAFQLSQDPVAVDGLPLLGGE